MGGAVLAVAAVAGLGRAAGAATEAFVSDNGAAAVRVFDAATAAPLASIPVAAGPLALAASPDGRFVYVGEFGPLDRYLLEFDAPGDALAVIDTAARAVVARIALPCANEASCRPFDVAATPDGGAVLVSHRCSVSIIDAGTRAVRASVVVHDEPCGVPRPRVGETRAQLGGIAVDAAGRFAYVVSGVETRIDQPGNDVVDVRLAVTVIDVAAGTIAPRVIDLGRAARGGLLGVEREVIAFPSIALSRDGAVAYAAHPLLPQLRRYDVAARQFDGAIDLAADLRPAGLAVGPSGASLHAAVFEPPRQNPCPGAGAPCPTLLRVDAASGGQTRVAVDVDPSLLGAGIASAPGGARAWVALTTGRGGTVFFPSGAVAVVDAASGATVAAVDLEGMPGGIAFVTRFACIGDCDGDGSVRVAELLIGVRALLGLDAAARCPSFDADGNGSVDVADLVLAVNALLNGCVGAAAAGA